MNFSWKRFLAMVLAIVMVVGMVPTHALHVHAEETEGEPEAQAELTLPEGEKPEQITGDGKIWVEDGDTYVDCDKSEHKQHTDECLTCDHKDGHLANCYANSSVYAVCPGVSDSHTHAGTSELGNVFGWDDSSKSITWYEDHPAYSAVRAVYDAAYQPAYQKAYDDQYNRHWLLGGGNHEIADLAGKAAGVIAGYNAVKDLTVCFSIPEDAVPECDHVHTDACYNGSLLGVTCPGYVHEHTHPGCYVQNWKEVADVNNNEQADDVDTYFTVKYMDGETELESYTVLVGLATPAYAGETPVREYYLFAGWGEVAEAVTADAVYTAQWTVENDENSNGIPDETEERYTVTFLVDGAVYAEGEPTLPGLKINAPVNPEKEGFGFDAWVNENGVAVSFPYTVEANVTLTAKFSNREARIGEEYFESLLEAIAAAQPGDTVVMLKNVTLGKYVQNKTDAAITIDKAITLDGNGYTLTSKAGRAINVDVNGQVEIKNLTIKQYAGRNSNDQKRCINVINQPAELKVTNCKLELVEHTVGSRRLTSYTAGVNVADSAAGAEVIIDGCEIGVIYGVQVGGVDAVVTIKNTTIDKALQCVNIEGAATVKVENSTLSTNPNFGANNVNVVFVVRAAGATITADANTVINVISPSGGAAYAIYSTKPEAVLSADLSKAAISKVNASDPVVYLANAEAQIYHADGTVMYDTLAEAIATGEGKVQILADALKSEEAVAAVNDDYKLVEENGEFYAVLKDFVAEVNGQGYTTLQKAINAANNGDTVALLVNLVEETEVSVTEKTVDVDLKGCTIDGALTLKGNGTIVIASGTVNGEISVLEDAKLAIYGGWFKFEPKAEWAAPGYVVVYDETAAMWTVENHDTANGNGVKDEDETMTVTIVGKGTVNGNTESFTFVYDSVKETTVSINAVPVIEDNYKSYVSSITANGAELELNYVDYCVTLNAPVEGNNIVVTFAEAKFEYDEDGEMFFYVGMEGVNPEKLYNAVITAPAYADGEVTAEYLARKAQDYELDVSAIGDALAQIEGIGGYLAKGAFDLAFPNGTYTISLGEKWLNVGDELNTDSVEETLDNKLVTLVEGLLANIEAGDYGSVVKDLLAGLGTIAKDVADVGCHAFGANETKDANGNVQETLKVTYKNDAMYLEDNTIVVTLVDDRTETMISGNNVSLTYKDYTVDELLAAIGATVVDLEGNPVEFEGEVILASDNLDVKTVGDHQVKFKYKGDANNKPCEGAVTLTVTKAAVSMDIPNVNVSHGEGYSVDPNYTLGNKFGDPSEIDKSLIKFVIGLDIAEFDYDGDGVKGLNGRLQLMLPADLQKTVEDALKLIGIDVTGGVDLTLNQLMDALKVIPTDSLGSLGQALESILSVVEAGDLTITLGGELPKNAGAYLYGAVSTNPNYETAFDVAYIVIAPALKEVYLDWNYTDSNGIFTWELLKYVDLGATAYVDPEFTTVDKAATDVMQNLFFGINTDGELVVELHGKHHDLEALEASLGNGAYTQLAFTLDIGNELVYAMPIVRAFVLVPGLADVQLVDAEGNALDTFNFTFDNAPKELYVMVDGELVECEITYTGVQTNLTVLEPTTEAPKHAGAYGALVVYTGTDENGELVAVGVDAAAITIAPAQSALEVTGGSFEHDGQAHGVTVNTNADVTMISGTVNFDAAGDGLGIEDVNGVLNVDFPAWLDKILSVKFANAYEYGVSTKSFLFKLQQHEAAMLEMGITEEIIRSLTNLMNNLPDNVVVYFNDNVAYTEPGVYAFFGIVTDSDYIPSYDTGLVTIGKEDTVVDMMNTTVVYNGQGQFVNVYNPDNNDFVTIIVDRENNIGNIIFEDDLNALVALVEEALGYELPKSINVAELHNAVDKILTAAEWIDKLDSEATTVLTQIRQVLAELPQSGVVYINGEWLPTNVGEYEFYGASYSLKFTTNLTEAVLTIVPAELIVVLDDVTIHQGEEIPELTYTVNGLYGDDVANVTASVDGNTITAEVEASENYKVTVVDGTLTIVPHTKGEPVVENVVDSSCTTEGSYDSVVYCSVCGVELSRESMTVPVKEHTEGEPRVENYVDSSCSAEGSYDSVVYCSVCEKELSRKPITVPVKEHTVGETVIEKEVGPTTTNAGQYDEVVYCTVCGKELSRKTVIVAAVAQNENTGVYYPTLQAAIDAVTNGETIVFLTNIDEDVTIKQTAGKSFTIDGNRQTYTGTMTIDGNKRTNGAEALTIKKVNFVARKNMQVSIDTVKNTSVHNLTVEDCTFTGIEAAEKTAYGMILRNAYNVVVKNTEGTGLFDLVYGNRAVTGFTAENVTVEDCTNGIVLSYVNSTATFKNVTTDADESGVLIRNNTAGSVYFEECNIDNVKYWQVENGKSVKMFFNDATNNLEISNTAEMLTIVLNKVDTTVTCETEDLNAITTEELAKTHKVVYENGVYFLKEIVYVAEVNGVQYESIQAAVNAAEDGDTIVIIKDHEMTWDGKTVIDGSMASMVVVSGKSVTIDLNGKNLTVDADKVNGTNLYAVFAVDEGGSLTLKDSAGNGSVKATGVAFAKSNTTAYSMLMAYEAGTSLTVESGTYYMESAHDSLIYSGADKAVTVNDGNFTLGNVGYAPVTGNNGKPWIFNVLGANDRTTIVNGGTYNADIDDPNYQYWQDEVTLPEKCCADNGNGTWTVGSHTEGAIVVENKVPATCTKDGSYDNVVYCTECGKELSRETVPVRSEGHKELAPVEEMRDTNGDGIKDTLYDVVYCETCGEEIRAVVKESYVCWNTVTGEYYNDVCEAVTAAKSGETVQMLAEDTTNNMLLWAKTGTTLDLNGYTVSADYVIFVNGSDLVDNSASNAGLMIPNLQFTLGVDNDQVPIYDENLGGYVFSVYQFQQKLTYDVENDTAYFAFNAYIETKNGFYTKYFGNGATDNKLEIAVTATWKTATSNISQNFGYQDNMVIEVVNSGYSKMYTFTLTNYSEYLKYGDITLTATIQSPSGAMAAGQTTVIPGTNGN